MTTEDPPPADTVLCPFILANRPCDARVPPGARLRSLVFPSGLEAYVATEAAHVHTVLTDRAFSAQEQDGPSTPGPVNRLPPLGPSGSLVRRTREAHRFARRLLLTPLGPAGVEPARGRITSLTNGLANAFASARDRPAEFRSQLADPLTRAVLPELLVISVDTSRLGYLGDYVTTTTSPLDGVQPARDEIHARVDRAVRDRTPGAGGPLVDGLLAAEATGRLGHDDVVGLTAFVYLTGVHGMASYLTSTVFALLRHPDQWALLCRHPELLPRAVQELTRYVPFSPVGGLPRGVTTHTRLGPTDLRPGDVVFPAVGFANRDPSLWPRADQLDITRRPRRHLGFGVGAHRCLGEPLARLQLGIVLSTLTRRVPHLRLAVPPGTLTYRRDHLIRSPTSLPVLA